MAFISENKIKKDRQELRAARQRILDEAKEDFVRKQQIQELKRQRGEDVWMLPSVDKRIQMYSPDSHDKKKKKSKKSKKSKHKKTKHKSRHEKSPESDEQSDEDSDSQWVEKRLDGDMEEKPVADKLKHPEGQLQRDNWMLHSQLFDDLSQKSKRRDIRKPSKEDNAKTPLLDMPGQHPKELNPYWKNCGTGLPQENTTAPLMSNCPESGNTEKEIITANRLQMTKNRWKKAKIEKNDGTADKSANQQKTSEGGDSKYIKGFSRPGTAAKVSFSQQVSSNKKQNWMKQEHVDLTADNEETSNSATFVEDLNKSDTEQTPRFVNDQEPAMDQSNTPNSEDSNSDGAIEENSKSNIPTNDDLNIISSKIVRAELMGDMDLANKLKQQLETARLAKDSHTKKIANTKNQDSRILRESARDLGKTPKESIVYLSRTTASGMEIPLEGPKNSNYGKIDRRRKKIKTHSSSGSRERYFADDDKHDLKSLFQHEKEGNSLDYNDMLSRLSNKGHKSLDSENFTLDDMFESNLSRELTPGQKYERERRKATFEQQKLMERQSKCQLCIDNSNFDKHLLIALGVKVYLSLPSHSPLTDGHCIISTMSHEVARTSLDEDILHEINVYRKGLTKMFAEKGMTAIFVESSMNLRRQYHLCIHCIPVPQEIGDMSPIYFKKAILEADTEWAQNKKLVSFNESKLTHSIPKGFPYFAVEFELNGGFAHVIEDESLFPSYFGQEIIGGMLDIEPYMWRRPPKENFNQQQKRVVEFSKWWKPYDWTQKIER